jgi:cell division protein FtsQ
MNTKVKNILRNIGFLLSVPVIIVAFVFAHQQDLNVVCKDVNVNIANPEINFLSGAQIKNIILDEGVVLNETKLNSIDVKSIEEKLSANPWVDKAELFIDANNTINAQVQQHDVVLRVQRTDSSFNGYFLDKDARVIPLSRQYFPHIPIVTSDRSLKDIQSKKDLVKLAQFIVADTFWNAVITQINYDKQGEIELVSVIGNAGILFGDINDMEDKFERLLQFYKKGITRINWSNVKELDVRFKKQLVCRRFHKEALIEERKAPIMYAKRKSQPIQLASKPVRTASATNEIKKNAPTQSAEVKTTSTAAKTNEVATKLTPIKEVVVTKEKTTEEKKEIKESTPPKKKRKEIIINTEPVTQN